MNPSWSHVAPAYHMRDPFANMGQFGNQAQAPTPSYGQRPYDHGPQPMPAYPYYPPQPQRAQPTYPQQPSYQQPSSGMDFQIGTFPIGNFGGGEDTRNGSQGGTTSPSSRAYETGIIEKLLHSYGFIQCCERQARLFFHFSQFEGNIEHLRIGDPVQFEVTFDKRNGKPIASTVSKITPESACGEERVTGVVTTELRNGEGQGRVSYENRGECFFLPYTKDDVEGNVTLHVGDTVSFQMTTSQRTGNLGALYIRLENLSQPVRYKGVVCAIRDGVGYIERADVVREISFKLTESDLGPIQLGDEVEFNIETQNGEEYACSMTRLPAGTVVFEDVDPNVFKGQVVKPLDRSVPVNQQDPLPGRLRFRGRDRSEKAVQFGEKDQKGNYTLRHGDWVQFNIATDRRDKLQRATNIELLDESFAFSGERRENGVVSSLKGGGGHIKCAEREAPLGFSIDEWITPDQELTVGDEVEFTVLQDPTAATKLSAIRIKGLDPGTVQFDMVIQKDLNGTVTREPPVTLRNGSKVHDRSSEDTGLVSAHRNGVIEHLPFTVKDSDSLIIPKLGDEVIFDLAQIKRNKELVAVNVRVIPKPRVPTPPAEKPRVEVKAQKPKVAEKLFENGAMKQNGYKEKEDKQIFQGWVAAIKDAYGFIETLEHDKEIFFHFSNYEGSLSNLDIGQEVEYTVTSKGQPQGKLSAENVRPLAKGSIARPPTASNVYYGTVVRQVRGNNPEQLQYSGIVKVGDLEGDGAEYEFGVTSFANKKDFLQRGDLVQFQLEGEEGSVLRAANIKVMRTKLRATVDHMKGQYGFLNYEVDEKKLFFHVSEVKDDVSLQAGDAVEFYLISNQKTGKNSASNVVKLDSQRPERLIQRVRAISFDETNAGPRIHVTRQPRGPDGTKGFRRVKQTLSTIHDEYE